MTPDELQNAIATLQGDLAETMCELREVRSRVWKLEHAQDIERQKRGRGTSRFQSAYPHGLGRQHE